MMLVLIPFGKLQRHTLGETDDRRLRSHNEQHTPRQARFQKLDVVFTKEAPDLRCGIQARVMLKNPLMFVLNICPNTRRSCRLFTARRYLYRPS